MRNEGSGEVYPLTGGPGLDLTHYLDQRATVYGTFVDEEPNGNVGTYLSVARVALIAGGTTTGETTTGGATTMCGTTAPVEERHEDDGTSEEAGSDVNEDGAVNEADGEFAVQPETRAWLLRPTREPSPARAACSFRLRRVLPGTVPSGGPDLLAEARFLMGSQTNEQKKGRQRCTRN